MGFSYYDDDSGYLPLTGGTLNGSLTIGGTNTLSVGGTDFVLGFNNTSRGNTGPSRAIVKGVSSRLIVNYAGDFTGGVTIQGPKLTVTGDAVIDGNASLSALYPAGQSFSSSNTYIVPEYLGGDVGLRGGPSGPYIKWVSNAVQIRNSGDTAYAPIDASAFTVNSESSNKSAILPLGSMLPEFEKLQFVEYLYSGMSDKMLGLEYAQTFAAGVTSILTNTPYSKGVNVSSLIALVGKALQEVVTELKTKGVLS